MQKEEEEERSQEGVSRAATSDPLTSAETPLKQEEEEGKEELTKRSSHEVPVEV